jgi:alkyl hydroperoxide reductase subunit AhpC
MNALSRCLLLTLAFAQIGHAEIYPNEAACQPLSVGAKLPDAPVTDAKRETTALKGITAGKPTVIVFFRGTWCPLCTLAMAHVAQAQPELEKMGYQIIAISSEAPEELAKFAPITDKEWTRPEAATDETKRAKFERERMPEKAITYRVVTEPTGKLAEAMGIAFFKDLQGTEYQRLKKTDLIQQRDGKHWLPLPGVFITDKEGIIRFVDLNRTKDGKISENYNRRIKKEALVTAARAALRQ